jgi:energy-coupling factor transporter ATP-binding protein EcfA2
VKLVEFSVTDFQSYGPRQTLRLDDHITFLAGRNDVGKSALLRALRIPVVQPEGIGDAFEAQYSWHVPTETVAAAFAAADPTIDLSSEFQGPATTTLEATLTFTSTRVDPNRRLFVTRVALPDLPFGAAASPPGSSGGWNAGPLANGTIGVGAITQLAHHLAAGTLHIAPRRADLSARSYFPGRPLDDDASNLMDALLTVQNTRRDIALALDELLREAFPQVSHVLVPPRQESGSSGFMGEVTVHYGGSAERAVPLRHCGTGVEQILALGLAVLTSAPGRLILIDEPQAHLHPHAERVLFDLLERHPEHQYVIATHSHTMLSEATLDRARLISMPEGRSVISDVTALTDVVDELELTPADLWLADRIIWTEGPSDVKVVEHLLQRSAALTRSTTVVRELPGASRFAAGKEAKASASYRLLTELSEAVAPLRTDMVFLFDADEKTVSEREAIERASGGRARFLPVRELENLFLSATVIQPVLAERAQALGLSVPTTDDVESAIDELVAQLDDSALYPKRNAKEPSRQRVKGSAVLNRLFQRYAASEYGKVADVAALTASALLNEPEALDPLAKALEPKPPTDVEPAVGELATERAV